MNLDLDPDAHAELELVIASAAKDNKRYVMGVDVGGTNTRVAVCSLEGKFVTVNKFLASSKQDLIKGLGALAQALIRRMGGPPAAACLDVAGPVSEGGTKVTITNYAGTTEDKLLHVRELPSTLFPAERTIIINDLESCCYGILGMEEHGKLDEYFEPLWGPQGKITIPPVHHAVLAAGTGLGVGLLIKLGSGKFQVMPLEFGHALITPLGVNSKDRVEDQKLLYYLSEILYAGKQSPEYEDIVSGRGLAAVYTFLSRGARKSPAEVVAAASEGDEHALKAVETHYRLLMRTAQNVCVGMNVKGVFLAGDNQVENGKLVKKMVKVLQEDFLDHPKREWIENAPVYAQKLKYNINLLGTLYVAKQAVKK